MSDIQGMMSDIQGMMSGSSRMMSDSSRYDVSLFKGPCQVVQRRMSGSPWEDVRLGFYLSVLCFPAPFFTKVRFVSSFKEIKIIFFYRK